MLLQTCSLFIGTPDSRNAQSGKTSKQDLGLTGWITDNVSSQLFFFFFKKMGLQRSGLILKHFFLRTVHSWLCLQSRLTFLNSKLSKLS